MSDIAPTREALVKKAAPKTEKFVPHRHATLTQPELSLTLGLPAVKAADCSTKTAKEQVARKELDPQADGAAGIRAVLTSSGLAAPTAAKMESTFLTRLESDLGGPGKAAVAYRMWLDLKSRPAPLSIDDITQSMRWESTLSKATWHALAEWPEAGDQAFFILHLK